jgi:hypothetical protein
MPIQTILLTVGAGVVLMLYLARRRSRMNKEEQ